METYSQILFSHCITLDALLLLGACLEESRHSHAQPAYQGSSSKKHNLVHSINSSGKASAIILNLKLNLDPSGN